MRSSSLYGLLALMLLLAAGCAGPERKLGRGIRNATEFARMGEIRRSMEQTMLWEGNETAYTTGFIQGVNRSFVRTGVGLYEIVTAPIPSYEPILRPGGPVYPDMSVDPVYPDSYKPHTVTDSMWEPDAYLGFSGSDVAPMIPGSRFRIFDY